VLIIQELNIGQLLCHIIFHPLNHLVIFRIQEICSLERGICPIAALYSRLFVTCDVTGHELMSAGYASEARLSYVNDMTSWRHRYGCHWQ